LRTVFPSRLYQNTLREPPSLIASLGQDDTSSEVNHDLCVVLTRSLSDAQQETDD
jgi:hypothetical protein